MSGVIITPFLKPIQRSFLGEKGNLGLLLIEGVPFEAFLKW